MTKEEYMQKLMNQFGEDETLIPETNTEQQEPGESVRNDTAPESETEGTTDADHDGNTTAAAEETSEISDETSEQSENLSTEDEKAVSEGSDGDEELINPENGKKFSNKRVKKAIWENKKLTKEVADLKRQMAELIAATAPKEEKRLAPPLKKNFSTDEDFANAVFAYNMQLLADNNKKRAEEQMAAARVIDEKQRAYDEKVADCIPESKQAEFDAALSENFKNLQNTLTMEAQDDIVSMSTTPLILWKLSNSPDLISAVNRMNRVERIMFCNKIAEQMASEIAEQPKVAPKPKAPVVGRVGTGKSAARNVEDMSADDMYSYMAKRLAGG